jgi:hypothetical protein
LGGNEWTTIIKDFDYRVDPTTGKERFAILGDAFSGDMSSLINKTDANSRANFLIYEDA